MSLLKGPEFLYHFVIAFVTDLGSGLDVIEIRVAAELLSQFLDSLLDRFAHVDTLL